MISIAEKYPELLQEWDYSKNDITPNAAYTGSAKKVWWKCEKNHSYLQAINYKTKKYPKKTCPFCSHQKLLKGFNDLETTHNYILKEWDYEKNDILPSEIGVGVHKKVWWKCPFGHSYQTYPSNRCGKNHSGCPICDKENHTSFPEQAIFYYLNKHFIDIENSNKTEIGMELDIYIPSIKTAIEYDGINWHRNTSKLEIKKNNLCREKNINLIRIREKELSYIDNCIIIVRNDKKSDESLNTAIKELFSFLHINENIDVSRDSSQIYNNYIKNRKEKSILKVAPLIAEEWHPTKNGKITPNMINYGSSKKVWWLGKCGHEWVMSVNDRTIEKCGCPICSGKRIVSGINDFASKYPEIAKEWYYELNNDLNIYPNMVAPHSDKKVWWKCNKCGNIWNTKIDGRTRMNSGCPKCGRKKVEESRYKPVICIETKIIYKSLQEAEEKTGINRMCIGNCCKGIQKTAGKCHWKYLNDEK